MKKRVISLLLIAFSISACFQNVNKKCDDLEYGTFDLYEKGEVTGKIFRKGNYQIEKYLNDSDYTIVKIKKNNCQYFFNTYIIRQEIDTITLSVQYTNIANGHYKFECKPAYLTNINYSYEGSIVKISNSIDNEIIKIFDTLDQ